MISVLEKFGILQSPISSKESVVDRIVDRITQAIINGELKPGDKVPTEVELCESLQVGRNSVREAIKVLVSFGVVEIRRAEGTFVCERFSHRMLDPMLYGLILERDTDTSLLELRRIFDTGVLQLATEKATAEDLQQVHKALENFTKEVLSPNANGEQMLEADIRFHNALARAVHNKLVLNIAGYIDRMTIPSRVRTQNQILKSGDLGRYIELHRELVAVVEHKDTAGIGKAVENHYTYWRKEV